MVNIVFIKTFVTLAQTRSFKTTAQLNNITQPAVSQQIHALENRLHCQLIKRSPKNIQLTPAGEIFLKHAHSILQHYEFASHEINDAADSYSGIIQMATIYSIGLYRLQPIIRSFLKKYPDVNVYLEYYHNDIIYDKLVNQAIDFGFVAFPRPQKNLSCEIITQEEMVLVQSPQRPIFKQKRIKISDLKHCRFVALSQTTPTGREMNHTFKKLEIPLSIVHEFENVETLKSAVIIGMGCALVPRNSIFSELRTKTLEEISVKGFTFKRPIGILKLKSKNLNKPMQKFYDLILTKGKSFTA